MPSKVLQPLDPTGKHRTSLRAWAMVHSFFGGAPIQVLKWLYTKTRDPSPMRPATFCSDATPMPSVTVHAFGCLRLCAMAEAERLGYLPTSSEYLGLAIWPLASQCQEVSWSDAWDHLDGEHIDAAV